MVKNKNDGNDRIEEIDNQIAKLEQERQVLEEKRAAQKKEDDKRKKFLAGAYILDRHEREGTYNELASPELYEFLKKQNVRKQDLELFKSPDKQGEAAKTIEKINGQIAKLEAKRQQVEARDAAQKKEDGERKKFWLGTYILDKYEQAGTYHEFVSSGLDEFLIKQKVRPKDRALFGLLEKEEAEV